MGTEIGYFLCSLVKEWYDFIGGTDLNWHPGKKFLQHEGVIQSWDLS